MKLFPSEQRSLFGEILDWMLAPLILLWPISLALTWGVAQNLANRPFDQQLANIALSMAREVVDVDDAKPTQATMQMDPQRFASLLLRQGDDDTLVAQVLGRRGEFIAGNRELNVPVQDKETEGRVYFRQETLGGETLRVAYIWLPSSDPQFRGRALVQVAESLTLREQLATEIVKGVIVPQFLVLPLAVLLVWVALTRGMAPLNELQQRIRKRRAQDLSAVDVRSVPEEISPLVDAFNDLMSRLDKSVGSQRRFLADAAHQLKTPLAGLRTQAELAQRDIEAGDVAAARRSLQQIARSSQRTAHMVNQLLALARAEDAEQALRTKDVNILRLTQDVVAEAYARASEKGIDLGLEGADPQASLEPVWVHGQGLLLRELLRNLLDNALHHAPQGGRVTVRLLHDPFGRVLVLHVEDNGPGVPESERALVFEPFFQSQQQQAAGEGSGLGLAIVKEIAERHAGQVGIEDAQPGARFTVRLPAVKGP